jgi:hypothetical protein
MRRDRGKWDEALVGSGGIEEGRSMHERVKGLLPSPVTLLPPILPTPASLCSPSPDPEPQGALRRLCRRGGGPGERGVGADRREWQPHPEGHGHPGAARCRCGGPNEGEGGLAEWRKMSVDGWGPCRAERGSEQGCGDGWVNSLEGGRRGCDEDGEGGWCSPQPCSATTSGTACLLRSCAMSSRPP